MLAKRLHVRRNAEGVNDQNGARARRNGPLHGRRIEIERDGIDLGKDRRRATLEHGVSHSYKGERGHDDLVALADAQRKQRQMQTGGAGADGHGVIHGVIRGQRGFKGRELGAQAEVRRAQDGGDGIDLRLGNVGRGEWNTRWSSWLRVSCRDGVRQRRGLLDEQAVERNGGEDAGDGDGGGSVAVGVRPCRAETLRNSGLRACAMAARIARGFGRRVDDVAGALAALLAHADVDHRQSKGGSFHDAAGGVADERVGLAEKAPVGNGVEIDEDVRVRRAWPREPWCAR